MIASTAPPSYARQITVRGKDLESYLCRRHKCLNKVNVGSSFCMTHSCHSWKGGGGEVVMGDGVCRESECDGMGSGSGHGSRVLGVKADGGKWVREEQGGRGPGNIVGAGNMVGNWG